MIGVAKSHRELFQIEASPQAGARMDYVKRPSGKPVNVAGCRERSRSSTRRFPRAAAPESEDVSSVTTDRSSNGENRRAFAALAARMEPAAQPPHSISMAERIRKKLKGVKRFPFLRCAVSKAAPTSGESYSKQPGVMKGKQGISKCGKKKTMPHDTTEPEPSLKIRALFPDKSDLKKIPVPSPLAKLKHTVFRARSTTPSNSDIAEPMGTLSVTERGRNARINCEAPPVSPLYSSGARRCRRQENLVKMMEKKLEEHVNHEQVQTEALPPPRRTRTAIKHVSDPSREARLQRYQRSRKIRHHHRSKARKGVHRRTVTY